MELKVTPGQAILAIALAGLFWYSTQTPVPGPGPAPPLPNTPKPGPKPCPGPGPCPNPSLSRGEFLESDGIGPGGVEVATDLIPQYRKKNIASKGLGCCVFRSIDHSAHYQNEPVLYGMPEWMVSKGIEGGGYPGKVDKLIPQMCQDKGRPTVAYYQHTGGDPKILELMLRTGRMPGMTYAGNDPRYNGPIDHMVNAAYLDDKVGCILDNNYIDKYLWMSREEFLERWKDRGGGWALCLLNPPPPPPPIN